MHNYRIIRISRSKEAIGIVEIPTNKVVWVIHYAPTYNNYGGGVMTKEISEAEFTSYQELGLFTVYEWTPSTFKDHEGLTYVDIYDPEYYEIRDCVLVLKQLTWPGGTEHKTPCST